MGTKDDNLKNLTGPLIIIFLFSLIVANLFTHIWETSSDVILHCYCIDDAIQSAKGGRAKYASSKLNHALEAAEKSKQRSQSTLDQSINDNSDYN